MALTRDQEIWVVDKMAAEVAMVAAEDEYRTVQSMLTGELLTAEQEYRTAVDTINAKYKAQQESAVLALESARKSLLVIATEEVTLNERSI